MKVFGEILDDQNKNYSLIGFREENTETNFYQQHCGRGRGRQKGTNGKEKERGERCSNFKGKHIYSS